MTTRTKRIAPASKALSGQGLRVASFFTGAGGLDLGFEQAGFETVYATDIDEDSCKTLRLNAGTHLSATMRVERADITELDVGTLPADIDLIIGGPPCQSFSASGRRAGGAAGRLDQRGNLFEAYCRVIDKVRPKAFVFENVRGILGTAGGDDWRAIVREFSELGYTISYRLLDALDYGVPQQRERMFLVGHKLDRPFLFPEPTHGPDSPDNTPHVTIGEAFKGIDDKEDLVALAFVGGKYSHLLKEVPPGQNYLYFTAKRGHPRPIFAYRSRFSDFLYKANPDAPVKTIIASPGKYTGPLHWDNRYFSIREYMRIQGFPDDYRFAGDRADIIRQIGNSVSPKIAYQLARAIADQIFGRASNLSYLASDRVLSFDRRKGQKAQKTRALHEAIVAAPKSPGQGGYFRSVTYESDLPAINGMTPHVVCRGNRQRTLLTVTTDGPGVPFAEMKLKVFQTTARGVRAPALCLTVSAQGKSPATVQAMWDAVDDWVRRASDFHSLFELYGHFTEPYPAFEVEGFQAFSTHPIAAFAAHAAQFNNCSRYFPKTQLVRLFSAKLGTRDFKKIAEFLRSYRFDIRSRETNIAIAPDVYMVAYPFNLPSRRQMNFRLRDRPTDAYAEAS